MAGRDQAFEQLRREVRDLITFEKGDFASLACAIYAFQFRYNAVYRLFCEHRGLTEKLVDWQAIPAVPQQAFKSAVLTTFPESTSVAEFRTSGTTGEGYGRHFFQDLTLYHAAIDGGWQRLGLSSMRKFVLTPSPQTAPHSSLSHMMGHLVLGDEKAFFWGENGLQEDRLRKCVAESEADGCPVLLLGTALAFLNLIEKTGHPLALPSGSRILETGGYKGSGRVLAKADFYARLTAFFSIPVEHIINEYGMTELSSQFYTQGLGQPHTAGGWMRHRIIDPLTLEEVKIGETGLLQCFDLANVGSVLAVQTEDLAISLETGFLLLGRDPSATARGCSRSADEWLNR